MSNAARWHPRELHTMVVVIDCLEKAREVHILQEDVEKRPPARLHYGKWMEQKGVNDMR